MSSSITHRRTSNRDSSRGHIDEEEIRLVRKKLEFRHAQDEDDDDEDNSCWSCSWKFAASLLLACALLGPFLFTSYKRYHQRPLSTRQYPEVGFFIEADKLSCALELNISYSQLFMDMKLNEVKEFCRDEDTMPCQCSNPTVPTAPTFANRPERERAWNNALERNQNLASSAPEDLDLVFLGDSIMELWLGTLMARPLNDTNSVTELWNNLFQDHAVVLGISADRSRNLLYRIQNGEMPDSLDPVAWWILIGTNDYPDGCNREAILVGQLAVLYETRTRKPNAMVILQGLLPRSSENLLESTLWKDF